MCIDITVNEYKYVNKIALNHAETTAAAPGFKSSNDKTKTKHELVSYLFELTYDLMLSAQSHVSQNPGFESFTGQF